jgi:hypothetical protein
MAEKDVKEGIKPDPKHVAPLDKSKLQKGKTTESAVTGQSYYGWFRSPYDGNNYFYSGLHYGANAVLDGEGNIFYAIVY